MKGGIESEGVAVDVDVFEDGEAVREVAFIEFTMEDDPDADVDVDVFEDEEAVKEVAFIEFTMDVDPDAEVDVLLEIVELDVGLNDPVGRMELEFESME